VVDPQVMLAITRKLPLVTGVADASTRSGDT
jgi:hypothetical protein